MSNDEKLSGLTRSLLIGVSLGSIALTQVGCAPSTATPSAAVYGGDATKISVRSADEGQLCTAALRSKAVADVNQLLVRYPDSRCIAPLLTALPAHVLAGLSPTAVQGISQQVYGTLPAKVVSSLPGGKRQVAGAVRVSGPSDNRY